MNEKEILEKAQDVIHEKGWAHGCLFDEHGKVCYLGALYVAAGFEKEFEPIKYGFQGAKIALFANLIPRHYGALTDEEFSRMKLIENIADKFYSLYSREMDQWNDHEAESADDIVHSMKHLSEEF